MNLKWLVGALAVVIVVLLGALIFIPGKEKPSEGGVSSATTTPTMTLATVGFGQRTKGLAAEITPLEVVEDSRCPVDVVCIQAGTVRIKASVDTYPLDFTFILGKPLETDTAMITLTAVTPTKHAGVEIKASDYRFTFSVEKIK